ncbi:hypothetical protein AB0L00_18310 [Actinoallomurus sp. NPDC052308]|uniref:hypothetical protein n=1 Tax=Actinoallomurus sp. NPDC052308 TaxID=3155530 RepID=UPI003422E531
MNQDSSAPAHQIEFRWRPSQDFGPIAWSPIDSQFLSDCHVMLGKMAAPPAGVVHGHRSLVYLDLPQRGLRAVIERSFDEDALRIDQGRSPEDGGRRPQVARAIVGRPDVVGIDFALACVQWSLSDTLRLDTGHIRPHDPLKVLDAAELRQVAEQAAGAGDGLSRNPHGLYTVIAAMLRHPSRPVSVLIPGGGRTPGDVEAYLRGLRHTAMMLLARAGTPWRPSFSTFEPPTGRATGSMPHLVFRDIDQVGSASAPVETRQETKVAPYDADPGGGPEVDLYDRLGLCLARAYAERGKEWVTAVLKPIAQRVSSFDQRLNAVLDDENLADFLPRSPAMPRPAHRADDLPPGPVERVAPGHPGGTPPVPVRHIPPASVRETAPSSPTSAARSGPAVPLTGPPPPATAPDARRPVPQEVRAALAQLYGHLHTRRGRDDFFEVLELISAQAEHGITLSTRDSDDAIDRLVQHRWYVPELEERYAAQAARRLSRLMFPLFADRLDDAEFRTWLHQGVADPTTPATWARAITSLYAELGNHPGADVLGAVLPAALIARSRADERTSTDGWPPRESARSGQEEDTGRSWFSAWALSPVPVPAFVLGAVAVVVIVLLVLVRG